MMVESSDQVARFTLLKRFPTPRNFKVTPESRIEKGRSWPGRAGASPVKRFGIHRYNPESGGNPRIDTFDADLDDCGAMVLDALIWINSKVDPTQAFRCSCREGVCPHGSAAWPRLHHSDEGFHATPQLCCVSGPDKARTELRLRSACLRANCVEFPDTKIGSRRRAIDHP
jgi:hypothetical protein